MFLIESQSEQTILCRLCKVVNLKAACAAAQILVPCIERGNTKYLLPLGVGFRLYAAEFFLGALKDRQIKQNNASVKKIE